MKAQRLLTSDFGLPQLERRTAKISKLPSCKNMMASCSSKGLREVFPPGFLSLPFGKLNAGSAQPVFTTDTQDIVLLVTRLSDAGRSAVHRFPCYNDIHKLIITWYHTFQDVQVRYRHQTRLLRCALRSGFARLGGGRSVGPHTCFGLLSIIFTIWMNNGKLECQHIHMQCY